MDDSMFQLDEDIEQETDLEVDEEVCPTTHTPLSTLIRIRHLIRHPLSTPPCFNFYEGGGGDAACVKLCCSNWFGG